MFRAAPLAGFSRLTGALPFMGIYPLLGTNCSKFPRVVPQRITPWNYLNSLLRFPVRVRM